MASPTRLDDLRSAAIRHPAAGLAHGVLGQFQADGALASEDDGVVEGTNQYHALVPQSAGQREGFCHVTSHPDCGTRAFRHLHGPARGPA